MSRLMRAPQECGAWWWEFDDTVAPDLASALAAAARMAEVLAKHQLLAPHKLEYDWYVPGTGGIGITTVLALIVPLTDPDLADRIAQSRPTGYSTAEVSDIRVLGSGVWIDAQDQRHSEPRLVDLEVSVDPVGAAVELTVHHDIWKYYDFSGRPHPEVHSRNAPRLAAALQELDLLVGTKAVPGEPTYFGVAEGYEIKTPEPFDDELGPDLTDRL